MADAAGSNWTEVVGDIWDQLLTLCEPLAVGHIQLTCKLWKQQCCLRLTQLELPLQLISEMQALAAAMPSIKQLRFTYRDSHVSDDRWYMPFLIWKEFPLLTSLELLDDPGPPGSGGLEVLEVISGLQALRLPDGYNYCTSQRTQLLPESLTAVSVAGLRWDIHGCNWLQQLSAIQSVSVQCYLLNDINLDSHCLDCLICAPNLKKVHLRVNYSQDNVSVLRGLSKLTSLSTLELSGNWDSELDPQLGCCPGDWLLTLTSVSRLDLEGLPAMGRIAVVTMTWLSALSISSLSMSAQGAHFGFPSTLSSLAQLTRLTSLTLHDLALRNAQVTFLHFLADLAVCDLDARQQILYTIVEHVKDLRHGYQAMFGLSALTSLSLSASCPLGPNPKLSALALNTKLQCLQYSSSHLVSSHIIKTVADLTCLTRLSLSGSRLPITLLDLSCLRWLKELMLLSQEVSYTNMGFVCSLRYLALLQLQKIAFRDTVFSQSEKLDKLTSLVLSSCPLVTETFFLS